MRSNPSRKHSRSYVARGRVGRRKGKTKKQRKVQIEEKVVGFISAYPFLTNKRKAVTRLETDW